MNLTEFAAQRFADIYDKYDDPERALGPEGEPVSSYPG